MPTRDDGIAALAKCHCRPHHEAVRRKPQKAASRCLERRGNGSFSTHYLDEGVGDVPDDEDAVVTFSVGFSKGRDMAFSGAVDNLVIDNMRFDFEPFGVTMTAVVEI